MLILRHLLFTLLLFISMQGFSLCTPGNALTPINVDSVTVDANGNVTICWEASPDSNIVKYYIIGKNVLTGANSRIDSVLAGTLCYTIPAASSNANSGTVEYAIGVKDACDNEMVTILDFNKTMYLTSTPQLCSGTILFNWNAYADFDSGTNVLYKVYAKTNSGAYALIGTTNTTSFNFTTVTQGDVYTFFVNAIEKGGAGPFSSTSNYVNVNTSSFLKDPSFNYLYSATVIDSQQVDVQFYVDTAADIREYLIKRALKSTNIFKKVGSIAAYQGMNPLQQFSDFNVNANTTPYYYKIYPINTCGDVKMISNFGKTMRLTVTSDSIAINNTLSWNNYDGWQGYVKEYEIYRSVGGVWQTAPVATVFPQTGMITYKDNISTITRGNGEFCYKVVAKENPILHVGNLTAAASTSNSDCVNQSPLLYVPNAFDPLSAYNPTFKPILTFSDPTAYSFMVFDRWGQKVFETNELNKGWNGQMNNSGSMSPSGTYVYVVRFKSATGDEFKKSGLVSLLK